jgi:septal ring factor EnvC (AmiA/AmiB activator)
MNTGVDSELVKVVQEHVRKLSSDVATMSFESQEQINNVTRMLTNIQLDLKEIEKRLQEVEHKQAILQHDRDILKKRHNNVEQRVTRLEQEVQDNCRSCTYMYAYLFRYYFDGQQFKTWNLNLPKL